MKRLLLVASLLALGNVAHAASVVFTSESAFLAELAALGLSAVSESFENDTVWADSRNSIVAPGSAPSVTSQAIVWTSNFGSNNIATGTVGGSAPDGAFAIYSLPHGLTTDSGSYCDTAEDPDIPIECYQNDGLKVRSADGATLFAFGGKIDTANRGKDADQVLLFADDFTIGVSAVPLPAAAWLFGSALASLVVARGRQTRRFSSRRFLPGPLSNEK